MVSNLSIEFEPILTITLNTTLRLTLKSLALNVYNECLMRFLMS
jgi:hypothetical protein